MVVEGEVTSLPRMKVCVLLRYGDLVSIRVSGLAVAMSGRATTFSNGGGVCYGDARRKHVCAILAYETSAALRIAGSHYAYLSAYYDLSALHRDL